MQKELAIRVMPSYNLDYKYSYESNEYPLKNGYYSKAVKKINSISLIAKDTFSYLTISPFVSRIKDWLTIWKPELEIIRRIFVTKTYQQYINSVDFHIGICDKEMYNFPKYIGWKYIVIAFDYDDVYNTWTYELEEAMAKKHAYIYNDCEEPKYIFFYKRLTKKAFINTFKVCKLLFDASAELNLKQSKMAKTYFHKQKLWTKI